MCEACDGQEEWTRQWVADHHPTQPEFNDEGTAVSAVDWLGHRFWLGDQVMYCVSAGRGQMMALGTVQKIKAEATSRTYYRNAHDDEEPDRTYTSARGETFRSMKEEMPYHEITVQVLTDKTSGRWDNKARSRPAWVNAMNITALSCPYDCGRCHAHENE